MSAEGRMQNEEASPQSTVHSPQSGETPAVPGGAKRVERGFVLRVEGKEPAWFDGSKRKMGGIKADQSRSKLSKPKQTRSR